MYMRRANEKMLTRIFVELSLSRKKPQCGVWTASSGIGKRFNDCSQYIRETCLDGGALEDMEEEFRKSSVQQTDGPSAGRPSLPKGSAPALDEEVIKDNIIVTSEKGKALYQKWQFDRLDVARFEVRAIADSPAGRAADGYAGRHCYLELGKVGHPRTIACSLLRGGIAC